LLSFAQSKHGRGLQNKGIPLRQKATLYISPFMKRIYDIADRAFLPWRFFGQSKSVIAAL
jgi:hypothetical protein